MLESIVPTITGHWPTALAILTIAYFASNYFNNGLQKYPGPLIAAFTDWWRFFDVYGRRPDITHIKLHREKGDIVRLGPNSLSFADPKAIKTIYGLNKGFTKVGDRHRSSDDCMADPGGIVRILPSPDGVVEGEQTALTVLNDG